MSYGYEQPQLHSSPPPCPLPSPRLCFSESDSASSSMTPSYQQIPPSVPAFDDGSSLHAGGISQPSFNASGSILSADLDAPVFSPLSSLDDGQLPPPPQQAQPASTTSTGMILGQTDSFFGLAAQDTSMQPLSSFPYPSFGPSPTMHGMPSPDLQEAPVVSQSQFATPSPLQSLGSQQQQPARPSLPAPSLILLGQSDRFTGFRQSTSALQLGRTWSSSRAAGLPPRWRPSRSRIDTTTTTTFGYVQPSSDSMLAPLPPSLQLQTPPSPPVELAAPTATGSETPGHEARFILPQANDAGRALLGPPPLLDSALRERFQLSRSLFMDDSSMVSMPTTRSIGTSGSSGSLLFTDAEMEKIRKEEHLSHLMKTDPKRVRRMLKNRESAMKSKERHKNHRVGLEDRLRALEMKRETLTRQAKLQQEELAEVASQNRMLNTRLQGLDQQLKLKEELNEALRSRIQNLKLGNLSSSSSSHQQMSLAGGQCSSSGLHQHMRNEVHMMSSDMVQLEQLEVQEQSLEHEEDKAGSKTTTRT